MSESKRVKRDREERKEYAEKKEDKPKTKTVGSRAEVFHGNALRTAGGLTKKDLIKNKRGIIVSKKKSEMSKKKDILARLK